jgi:MFS family permease
MNTGSRHDRSRLMSRLRRRLRKAGPEDTLRANRDFARFWLGESVSVVGSQMTEFALPMVGLLLLRISAGELGVLSAIQFGSIALAAVPAGAVVDRCRTREVIIATNVGRALVCASVLPLAATGRLSFAILCAIAFAGGALTGVFDVAYVAYLPELVSENLLVGANARLEGSVSVGEISGQGLGGVVVQLLGGPLALLFDALTYVFSTFMLLRIRRQRPAPVAAASSSPGNPWTDFREGLRVIWGSRTLKALMVQSAWLNTLLQAIVVALPVYFLRTLDMGPAALGGVLAAGSVGALIGYAAAGRIDRRYGIRSALAIGMSLACCAQLLLPLFGERVIAACAIGVGYVIYGFGLAVFNVLAPDAADEHRASRAVREDSGDVPARELGRDAGGRAGRRNARRHPRRTCDAGVRCRRPIAQRHRVRALRTRAATAARSAASRRSGRLAEARQPRLREAQSERAHDRCRRSRSPAPRPRHRRAA